MTPTYDNHADALYIEANARTIARQVEMPDGVIVDVDLAGHLVGIEVLSPSAGWRWREIVDRFQLDGRDEAYLKVIATIRWGDPPYTAARSGEGGQVGDSLNSLVA